MQIQELLRSGYTEELEAIFASRSAKRFSTVRAAGTMAGVGWTKQSSNISGTTTRKRGRGANSSFMRRALERKDPLPVKPMYQPPWAGGE